MGRLGRGFLCGFIGISYCIYRIYGFYRLSFARIGSSFNTKMKRTGEKEKSRLLRPVWRLLPFLLLAAGTGGCSTVTGTGIVDVRPLRLYERGVSTVLVLPAGGRNNAVFNPYMIGDEAGTEIRGETGSEVGRTGRWWESRRDAALGVRRVGYSSYVAESTVRVDLRRTGTGNSLQDSNRLEELSTIRVRRR